MHFASIYTPPAGELIVVKQLHLATILLGRFFVTDDDTDAFIIIDSIEIPWEEIESWSKLNAMAVPGGREMMKCSHNEGKATGSALPEEGEFIIGLKSNGNVVSGTFVSDTSQIAISYIKPANPGQSVSRWSDLSWWFAPPQFPLINDLIKHQVPEAIQHTPSSRDIAYELSADTVRDLHVAANLARHELVCDGLNCDECRDITDTITLHFINLPHAKHTRFGNLREPESPNEDIVGVDKSNRLFLGEANALRKNDGGRILWKDVLVWARYGEKEGHRS